jgi:hypothetical protein
MVRGSAGDRINLRLSGRFAEADAPEFEPVAESLAEGYRRGRKVVVGVDGPAGLPLPGVTFSVRRALTYHEFRVLDAMAGFALC